MRPPPQANSRTAAAHERGQQIAHQAGAVNGGAKKIADSRRLHAEGRMTKRAEAKIKDAFRH
jgi:hypothetical protein